ncbi:hypothetical protein AK830_g1129 [Neonectria ditissima]|uniref:NADPH-dependent 1-acyldihydroxyacetone phosphate reductase n=1 Tax=Neonectria ditissima TaxID=78410 RepID=A0A0P7C073_9HYPO|nr:hypothetical protein AK830_g1129 [Neonectria ditissima]
MASQKTALVTGTSKGGLGDYLARELHQRGFRVFATARSPSKVQHLKDLGLDIVLLEVTDSESIKKAAAEVNSLSGGKLDVLINNSGIGDKAALLDVDLATAKSVFDVNIWGVLEVTQAFSPMIIASKGTIVNIGSVVGRVPIPFNGIYNISKAALEHLSRQMHVEMAPFDVKVVHVVTGGINTSFFSHAGEAVFSKTSLYYPARDSLGPWLSGQAQEVLQQTSPEKYAKNVIDSVLSKYGSSCLYTGYGSFAAWFFSKCLWNNATDILLRLMGVPDMKKSIFGNKKDA